MKKTLLSSAVLLGLLSTTNALAQERDYFLSSEMFTSGTNSIGIERVNFKTDSDGSLGDLNMFGYQRGYDLSDYISLSLNIAIPIDNKVTNEYKNTYFNDLSRDSDPIVRSNLETRTYENEIKPSALAGVNLKLELPLHERLTGFLTLGASYMKAKHTGFYMEDLTTGQRFDKIVNVLPSQDLNPALRDCDLTGGSATQSGCNYAIRGFSDEYDSFGYSYGVGVNLNINHSNAFVLQYKVYNYDTVLSPESIYLGWQWKF